MKKVLFVIASKGFQPIEYGVPKQILEDEDIKVVTASDRIGKAVSSDGSEVRVDFNIDDINVDNYNGIFIIGGPGAMEHLDNERTYRIIKDAYKSLNKIFGAICISTRILAHADVLDGAKVTGWNDDHQLKGILADYNAEYIDTGVVVYDNIITADGPNHANEFGQAILKKLYK